MPADLFAVSSLDYPIRAVQSLRIVGLCDIAALTVQIRRWGHVTIQKNPPKHRHRRPRHDAARPAPHGARPRPDSGLSAETRVPRPRPGCTGDRAARSPRIHAMSFFWWALTRPGCDAGISFIGRHGADGSVGNRFQGEPSRAPPLGLVSPPSHRKYLRGLFLGRHDAKNSST